MDDGGPESVITLEIPDIAKHHLDNSNTDTQRFNTKDRHDRSDHNYCSNRQQARGSDFLAIAAAAAITHQTCSSDFRWGKN